MSNEPTPYVMAEAVRIVQKTLSYDPRRNPAALAFTAHMLQAGYRPDDLARAIRAGIEAHADERLRQANLTVKKAIWDTLYLPMDISLKFVQDTITQAQAYANASSTDGKPFVMHPAETFGVKFRESMFADAKPTEERGDLYRKLHDDHRKAAEAAKQAGKPREAEAGRQSA